MTVALALAILVVGLGMLTLAAVFCGGGVRRTKAREQASESYGGGTPEPYGTEGRPPEYETDGHPSDGRPPEAYRMEGRPPEAYGTEGGPLEVYGTPPPARLPAPRDMWIGAGISATFGIGALVSAAVVLIAAMAAPSRVLHAPVSAGGLQRDDSPRTQEVTSRQRERLRQDGMPNPLTAVYHRPDVDGSNVLFIGASGRMDAPASRLRALIGGLAASIGTPDRRPTGYPAGRLKGTVLCLDRLNSGQAMLTTCGWADDSTLGVITTEMGDASQTAALLLSMRDDMETKT